MNIDKHYTKYEHYMHKIKRYPCPEKIYFEIREKLKWEETKKKSGIKK